MRGFVGKEVKSIRTKISRIYMRLSYMFYFLPRHRTLLRYESYQADLNDFEHFDFYPLANDTANLHALWFADLITPSIADSVRHKMRSTQWRAPGSDERSDDWVRGTREIGGGGWRNLGWITREQSRWMGSTVMRDLPDEFSSASLTLVTITPSLSAVVGCFYLKEEHIRDYENVAKFPTWGEAVPLANGALSIHYPRARKEKALAKLRADRQRHAALFFKRHFGTFFSIHAPDKLPMIEFLEFSQADSPLARFIRGHGSEWNSKTYILSWQVSGRSNDHLVGKIYYLSEELPRLDLEFYGGNNAHGLIGSVSHSIETNWAIEATFSLIRYYEGMLSAARDRAFIPIVGFKSKRRFVRLERTREMADIPLIMSEVVEDEMLWVTSSMMNFSSRTRGDNDQDLKKGYRAALKRRAQLVLTNHHGVSDAKRSMNESYATLQASQISMITLYIAMISSFISVAALVVAIFSSDRLLSYTSGACKRFGLSLCAELTSKEVK
jgi:hypothetical protein